MSQKLIAFTGVTGSQGSSVASHFLRYQDWRVRGVTRNPDSPKARRLANKGVELVRGDFDDVASLRRAFKGANAIFAVTDYAVVLSKTTESEGLRSKAAAAGQTLSEFARDWEFRHGLNIAEAASDPDMLPTLTHFVFSTLTGIKKWSDGKCTTGHQFDSKAAIEHYIRDQLPELSKRLSTVAMGIYLENCQDQLYCAPHKDTHRGGYYFVKPEHTGDHIKFPEVWCSRDAGAFVDALIRRFSPGIDLMGARYVYFYVGKDVPSKADQVRLPRRAVVKSIPADDWKAMIPKGHAEDMYAWFRFVPEFGFTGGNPRVKLPQELGIETTALDEFFENEDWSRYLWLSVLT
ncbi:NmrA-like family protein [Zymoseptoria brevis]|uniref:NmrA-like family protein n=1 Tax=Zymoseptoria brevis TaxID=1047168 RepID=A0A0F4GUX1_9PEZI|nr:NmrA-like family protein [Zymoseptoria brevis]